MSAQFYPEDLKGRDLLENIDEDERIILKWLLNGI
jgi:hypothetical protein